ncbi:hypothetical protein FDUTEX481_03922 [Tolypothrix sp. PCC 7601]|nr:hypothetical protein FDUTEX481_03922 [Tolypothrix sp. PCC 7601]
MGIGYWALGIGHWALGIGHWALVIISPHHPHTYSPLPLIPRGGPEFPSPQSPVPTPQSPVPSPQSPLPSPLVIINRQLTPKTYQTSCN